MTSKLVCVVEHAVDAKLYVECFRNIFCCCCCLLQLLNWTG